MRLLIVASLWLCTVLQGWAQTAAAKPLFIDSPQECAAFSGAWVAGRDRWQAACQPQWPRDECLRLGGGWTPIVGAPLGGLCVAQVSQGAIARQCTQAGGVWGPAGSSMPLCQPAPAARRQVVKSGDAGKACDSQSDCIYGCVYKGPPVADGTNVMGQCRPTNTAQGCYSMVEKGRMAGSICVN